MLGGAHGRCALGGGHSVRYGTSYVSRHCIRIGPVLDLLLDGGTATRVADAADAADADFIVPHAARTHTSHAHRGRGSALAPAYLYCTPLTVLRSRSRSRSHRGAAAGRQHAAKCDRRRRCRTSPAARVWVVLFLRKCLFFFQMSELYLKRLQRVYWLPIR